MNQEITYSFTIYFTNGDKVNTSLECLEDARNTYKRLAGDVYTAEFSITKWVGNDGDEISKAFFNEGVA